MLDSRKPATTTAEKAEEYSDRWAEEINQRARRRGRTRTRSTPTSRRQSPLDRAAGEAGRTLARELIKRIFRRR
jgi:hypothetical protein